MSSEPAPNSQVAPSDGDVQDDTVKVHNLEEGGAEAADGTAVPMKEVVSDEVPSKNEEPDSNGNDAYHPVACQCLPLVHPVRRFAIQIYENPNFDRTTMALIGGNCITLALFDPTDEDCERRCKVLSVFDQIFALYFTVEMVVKMLALGVFQGSAERGEAYFVSKWNQFDFIIVVTGLIDFLPLDGTGSLSALRTFRVLRPLRAINKFPKLRVLVKLLLDTIPMLSAVGMLCFFIFFVFGIIAVQFWAGLMHQRCFNPNIATNASNYATSYFQTDDGDAGDPYICSLGPGDHSTGPAACITAKGVPDGFTSCRKDGPTPFSGAIHYDNILAAWIVLFQVITLEGWVDQMYYVQGAWSFNTGWIYFCTFVVIGGFFAVNLALVVISSQFGNSKGSEMAAIEAAEAKAKEAARQQYLEAKARGDKLSFWQQLQSGDLFTKSEEQQEEERVARVANLKAIAESMPETEAKAVVEKDIARLEEHESFPITEAEANKLGGIEVHRYAVRRITVIEENFGNVIMACISINVLLMATEHHNQPDALTQFLKYANYIFCVIFTVEMLLKWFGLGPPEYFQDPFNCFDCVIVFISWLEIALGGGGLSVLRMLRLVRVFRLVKFLPELQRQIAIMGETLGSVFSFLVLLALFIFIFAVLGMFLFGNKMTYDEEDEYGAFKSTSRKNYDTLLWALVTIFQTLTLEDWNAGMYDKVRGWNSQVAALYDIILIMLGNYIMFNLFVAILIDGFGDAPEEEEEADAEAVDTLRGNPTEGAIQGRRVSKMEAQDMLAAVADFHAHPAKASEGSGVGSSSGVLRRRRPTHAGRGMSTVPRFGSGSGVGDEGAAGVPELESVSTDGNNNTTTTTTTEKPDDNTVARKYIPEEEGVATAQDTPDGESGVPVSEPSASETAAPPSRDLALGIFAKDNPVRKQMSMLTSHPIFDQFIMACIIINSICMAFERPAIEDGSTERLVLDIFGHCFTFVFSVEMIMKLIAHGVFFGPDPYWDNAWNRLDGTIVVISWLDLLLTIIGVSGGFLSMLKICRMLRALRPLRAINRLPGLKKIVNVLIASLAPIGTTLIIVSVFFFLFGVLGGQIFSGQFYYCDTGDRQLLDCINASLPCINTKDDCIRLVGENSWVNQKYNFDHLGNSLMTLFVLSSIDGWVEIMYNGVDIAGVDKQPKENNSEGLVIFFIGFLLIGGFFIINMFVGVIVENFQKNGEMELPQESAADEEPEPEWDMFEDNENYPAWRRAVLAHATSSCFESSIAAVIIANVIVMGSEHYDPDIASSSNGYDGMSDGFKLFLRIANYIFTIIFVYELVVKYVAFGFKRFHMGSHPRSLAAWNNFDWFIVFISLLGILFDDIIGADSMPIDPGILRILRILRVARILKLLKSAKDLVILLTTVSRSLAQVGNLGLLLFLLFFIYSALGIELFGRMACTDNLPCDGLSDYANFKNFGMAMLVLFRLSTGDNWNGMMKDGLRDPPPISNNTALNTQYGNDYGCSFAVSCGDPDVCCAGCNDHEDCKENCCASAALTPLYYISFCIFSTFVMLNLVVATLMGELERAGTEDAEEEKASDEVKPEPNAPISVETTKPENNNDSSAVAADTNASLPDEISQPESVPSSPESPSPASTSQSAEEGHTSGARRKLDPLPIRPVSPTVFVPFAPETIDNDCDHDAASGNNANNTS